MLVVTLCISQTALADSPLTVIGSFDLTSMPTTNPDLASIISIHAPWGMTFDATSGHLFILDGLNGNVFEVTKDGKLVVFGPNNNTLSAFNVEALGIVQPSGITVSPLAGTFFVVGAPIPVGAFPGLFELAVPDRTLAYLINTIDLGVLGLIYPSGITFNPSTNTLFIVDNGGSSGGGGPNDRMAEVSLEGNLLHVFDLSYDGASSGIAYDPTTRTFLISDALGWLHLVTPSGKVFSSINLVTLGILQPSAVAIDTNSGDIFIADNLSKKVFKLAMTAISVAIDIIPGEFPNSINPQSNRVIPVAILTTDTFDAITVDPLTVEFGPNGATEAHGRGHIEDVDGDGDNDLTFPA
jgi:DNA-binding beta-propeller fold protein YncE